MIRAARTATLTGALLIALTGPGAATEEDFDWLYSSKFQIAGTQQDGNRLLADCQNGEILVIYKIAKSNLAPALAKRKRAYLMVVVDEADDGRGTFTSINSNFIEDDDSVKIGFGGKGALKLAREMSEAERNIVVGVSVKNPTTAASYTKYNTTRFAVTDAADTLESLIDECGDE